MLNGFLSSQKFPHYSLLLQGTKTVCVCVTLPLVPCVSSKKRETEYRLSRECARLAFSKIDPALSSIIIVNNPDRSPVWPKGYVGSITHTDGYVSAAVAISSDVRAIGIDSEKIIAAEIISGIKDQIANKTEQALCIDISQEQFFYTLLFSSKESVFKALYPAVKHFFDFTDIRFLGFDTTTGKFRVKLLSNLCEEFMEGMEIEGAFEVAGGYVNTSVIMLNDKTIPPEL